VTHKLLLRSFDQLWKVHYEVDTMGIGESRLYSKELEALDYYNEDLIPMTDRLKSELDSMISESTRIINDPEFIVGFFSGNDVHQVCMQATKESSYDDFYIKRTYLDEVQASSTFYFGGDNVLTDFEVILLDVESWILSSVYQYMIEMLIEEYGKPYNANITPTAELYRYKEIKWFLQGYNEELIISIEYQNITISLKEAI